MKEELRPFPLVTLKKRLDFQRVASVGHKHITRFFILQTAPQVVPVFGVEKKKQITSNLRFGFIITRKMGGAVQRNRIRRRLRAALREVLMPSLSPKIPLDVVIISRTAALEAPFENLKETLHHTLTRTLLFEKTPSRV